VEIRALGGKIKKKYDSRILELVILALVYG
jgi:hypothetical protein